MQNVKIISILAIAFLMAMPLRVYAGPSPQSGCVNNALVNPSFEEGFSDRGAGELTIANGWNLWYQDGPFQADGYNRRPEYKPEDASKYGRHRIHHGNFAQKMFTTYSTHNAGLWQQVAVPVNSQLTFSIWVQVWSSEDPNPDNAVRPGNYRVWVGIDPTGGTDWQSPNIIWSEPRMEYNTWMQLSVNAVAKAGTITVFTRGNPEFRSHFNDSYWDDACLSVIKPTPKPTTPKPTNTPQATATPTLSPTPTASPTPMTANICFITFEDANGNGKRDTEEVFLHGVFITVMNIDGVAVSTFKSTTQDQPICVEGLPPGNYIITRQNPYGYESTSPDNWGVAVVGGTRFQVEFGARLIPTATATSTPAYTPTPTPRPTSEPLLPRAGSAIYHTSGLLVALVAFCLPVGFYYLKKRL